MSSGDSLLILTPGNAELSGSIGNGFGGPATLGTLARIPSPTGPQENASVIVYPDDDSYFAVFNCVMPNNYTGGGLLINILWTCAAIVGVTEWTSWFTPWFADDPFLTKEPDGGRSITDLAPTVARDVLITSIPHSDGIEMNNIVANDLFRLVFYRNAPGPPDNIVGDLELLALHLTEQ